MRLAARIDGPSGALSAEFSTETAFFLWLWKNLDKAERVTITSDLEDRISRDIAIYPAPLRAPSTVMGRPCFVGEVDVVPKEAK